MKKTILKIIVLTSCLFILDSCAQTAVEKNLNQKISKETQIETQTDLNRESANLIENAEGLTANQKTELILLRDKTRALSLEQTKESLRLRSVLIKDLLAENYNSAEVGMLKKKIMKTDSKKLSILLDAIRKTNTILGREARTHEYMMRDFYNE